MTSPQREANEASAATSVPDGLLNPSGVVTTSKKFRSLASKFSLFTSLLVLWVVIVLMGYDFKRENFDLNKSLVMCVLAVIIAVTISRFTARQLARPLLLLQKGIDDVQQGRLVPMRVSRTP